MNKYNLKLRLGLLSERIKKLEDIPRNQTQEVRYRDDKFEAALIKNLALVLFYFYGDVKKTFKPYKNGGGVGQEFFTLVLGIFNLAYGLIMLLWFPATLSVGLAAASMSEKYSFKQELKESLVFVPMGIVFALRGITQILASPLTLLRIPFRALITAITGVPKIEENKTLNKLIQDYNDRDQEEPSDHIKQEKKVISDLIFAKVQRAFKMGQPTAKNRLVLQNHLKQCEDAQNSYYNDALPSLTRDALIRFFSPRPGNNTVEVTEDNKNANTPMMFNGS